MSPAMYVHIAAGSVGLVSGLLSVVAPKGGSLHKRSGNVFTGAMLIMAGLGAGIAASRGQDSSILGGVLAIYLVVTAWTTVRPPTAQARTLDRAAMVYALGITLASLAMAADTMAAGKFARQGVPVPMLLIFGTVSLLGALGDWRMLKDGPPRGSRRIARHLWRMCFAFFIATGSFFLGQADELPESFRIMPLLALFAFAPLLVMAYWMWRLSPKRKKPAPLQVSTAG
ncbi:MAG TPA: hypothetical protein VF720_16525 [Candidatus Eisenbacteria bacterium]